MTDTAQTTITIPEGFTLHTENSASILLPSKNEAFLNPVQEFNRDLSVACITVWTEESNRLREQKWLQKKERDAKAKAKKKLKCESLSYRQNHEASDIPKSSETPQENGAATTVRGFTPQKFVVLEALSATGLRSIRYAKEIPLLKHVIANDLSPSAVAAIRRNVEINDLEDDGYSGISKRHQKFATVRINEGDACSLMYSHRSEKQWVDCVDLDPYGTAAPFIDAAVQCINDGGLLCVTCTDLAVLATTNYSEKCFSNYGGIPAKAEYCHEVALRLVLHTISTSAARYGRYIHPLLSLSIDFYVRLFVRVQTAPVEVKKAASKTSTFYICSNCQAFFEQPLGRLVEKTSDKTGQVNVLYKQKTGPPVADKCPECTSVLHVAGPMWNGPIHDSGFVGKVLEHTEANNNKYGTSTRMKGMLTVAKEELDTPFYFTPGKVSGNFHCISPPLDDVASALLNAGHSISRSHALAGSLKTTATRQDIHDVFRGWVKKNPVRLDKLPESSPTHHLLSKEPRFEANFEHHPQTVTKSSKVKLVRYQQNPTANWGPGTKATSKRKREDDDNDET
ncbi:N2,N2-dimethylguanosine tRNA methyltransferase [Rickenella mellea]|uniref:tRNA (guanine(26)-N(2))-dimethyltransferase n=1 Tax=Rickenella mellea TaxID=50990 RepID=A0A4Y7QD68_9AGAM|nr:N2,N2-dimethylguanosine tRNA methyltransferase [Rickenella mellea]